jgi:hypothetical protein
MFPLQVKGELYQALNRSLDASIITGQHEGRTHRAYEATVNILKTELRTSPDKMKLVPAATY